MEDDTRSFFLQVMHMHRWAGARLCDTFGFGAITVRSVRDTEEGEPLARTVVDRIGIARHRNLQTSLRGKWFFLE